MARNVEAYCTFRDVARQSAACDMVSLTCHVTLTSTLRDTLQDMLHRVTLPLDVTTRDGISSRPLIELVTFLGLEPSLTPLPYWWIPT